MPENSGVPVSRITINGKDDGIAASSIWSSGVLLPAQAGQILIDYDAMIYRPLD
jgi:hypothetical protein